MFVVIERQYKNNLKVVKMKELERKHTYFK